MAWGATISQPYAAAVFSVTASAAFRITSSTKSGWDSIGTWLLSVSKVFAPIRFATKRSKAGWMVRSLLATMYQLGFDFQADRQRPVRPHAQPDLPFVSHHLERLGGLLRQRRGGSGRGDHVDVPDVRRAPVRGARAHSAVGGAVRALSATRAPVVRPARRCAALSHTRTFGPSLTTPRSDRR